MAVSARKFISQKRPRNNSACHRCSCSTERYSEENADVFLDNSKIIGPASFFKGFGHISAIPGVHARLGAHFSVGAFDKYVKAFEMGIMIDAFVKPVPIMVIENNSPAFINGYISFQIGKRQ